MPLDPETLPLTRKWNFLVEGVSQSDDEDEE